MVVYFCFFWILYPSENYFYVFVPDCVPCYVPDESENMIGTKNIESKDFLNFLMMPYFEIEKFSLSLELNLDEEHNYDSVPKCLNAEYWDSKETP